MAKDAESVEYFNPEKELIWYRTETPLSLKSGMPNNRITVKKYEARKRPKGLKYQKKVKPSDSNGIN